MTAAADAAADAAETSKKGHNYITVFVNLDNSKVVFVTGGKDQTTVERFASDFVAHNGDCGKIGVVTCDMSLGFKAGITTHFTNAVTIIDKFHVIKHANEAIDKVRRAEVKENDLLKNTRYIWLHNDDTLSDAGADSDADNAFRRLSRAG